MFFFLSLSLSPSLQHTLIFLEYLRKTWAKVETVETSKLECLAIDWQINDRLSNRAQMTILIVQTVKLAVALFKTPMSITIGEYAKQWK